MPFAYAGHNPGDLITAAAINAISDSLAKHTTKKFNVYEYGDSNIGNGVANATPAISSGATAAVGGVLKLPAGTFLIRPTGAGAINLSNITVEGDGPGRTIIKFDPTWIIPANGTFYVGFQLNSNVVLRGLTIDGSRSAVDTTGFSAMSSNLLRCNPTTPASDILLENLELKSAVAVGSSKESFGILTERATNVVFRHIEAWDIQGSGLSFDGDFYTGMGGPYYAHDVYCHDNTWQGFTVYAAKDAYVHGVFANNAFHGVNIEWCDSVVVSGYSHDNGLAGLATWGYNTALQAPDLVLKNNGTTTDNQSASIALKAGSYRSANPSTGIVERGITQDITVTDGSNVPATGKPALYVGRDVAGTNKGTTVPQSIVLAVKDANLWKLALANGNVGAAVSEYVPHGTHFPLVPRIARVQLGDLLDWTKTAATSIATYSSGGNVGQAPKTVTTTLQFGNLYAPMPDRGPFLVKVRYKLEDAATWRIFSRDPTVTTIKNQLSIQGTAQDVGVWFESSFFTNVDLSKTWMLQIQCDDTGTHALTIDYIDLYMLDRGADTRAHPYRDIVEDWGTAPPTFGTYPLGSVRNNSAPAELGTAGSKYVIDKWRCVTAGTPGTWVACRCLTGN